MNITQSQEAERGDSCGVLYFAVPDHPFKLRQPDVPRDRKHLAAWHSVARYTWYP